MSLLSVVTLTIRCPIFTVNCADGEWGVDPDLRGEFRGPGRAGHKALRTGGVGGGENVLPLADHLGGIAEVDLGGGEQADAAMPVLGVVPREERPAELLRLLDVGEPAGEAGWYLTVLNCASE